LVCPHCHPSDSQALVHIEIRWDWPLYYRLADEMKAAAKQMRITIEWGGDWKTFKDGPHFQLPWSLYP
jgi:peptidoglycan L-alanyl-D-glutamate endopeptidase CwlK